MPSILMLFFFDNGAALKMHGLAPKVLIGSFIQIIIIVFSWFIFIFLRHFKPFLAFWYLEGMTDLLSSWLSVLTLHELQHHLFLFIWLLRSIKLAWKIVVPP
jgi:hypothetical protein